MYLSRAELDPPRRETMVALISPQKFHGAVENAFPGARRRRLWRLDQLGEKLSLLLLSEERPDLTALCAAKSRCWNGCPRAAAGSSA